MQRSILGAALLLMCACGNADGPDASQIGALEAPAGAATGEQTNSDVIHQLTIDDETLTFHWLGKEDPSGNDTSIAIEEQFRSVDYVRSLQAELGPVTSLEIFFAFAPPGLAPHAVLIAAHDSEAAAMGRTGEQLAIKALDGRQLSVQKAIQSNCQVAILPDISPGAFQQIQTTNVGVDGQFVYTCAGSPKQSGVIASQNTAFACTKFNSGTELSVGICNDSASPSFTRFFTRLFRVTDVTTTQRSSVVSGFSQRFIVQPTAIGTPRALAVIGFNEVNDPNNHRQVTGVGVF